MCSVFKKIWSVLEAAEHRGALATPSGKHGEPLATQEDVPNAENLTGKFMRQRQ